VAAGGAPPLRARGWGLALLPVAVTVAGITGHARGAVAELAVAGILVTWAPRLAAKVVPYAVLGLAGFGLVLAKSYHDCSWPRPRWS
jgi:hypothetical protein